MGVLVSLDKLKASHRLHHLGIDRTMSIARKQFDGEVTRKDVSDVVHDCDRCRSVDSAPVRWKHGSLNVDEVWSRLAMDVTHYKNELYLTLVDCGPGRFAIWRKISTDSAENVYRETEEIFRERGPPTELLVDNGPCCRSFKFKMLCDKWSVLCHFRCAFRPETNGIVERNHRTIKRMAARTGESPLMMVYWYNVAERKLGEDLAPARYVHTYEWRMLSFNFKEKCRNANVTSVKLPLSFDDEDDDLLDSVDLKMKRESGYEVGDRVIARPPDAKCVTEWKPGTVTDVKSDTNIEVDGIPRHFSDIRSSPVSEESKEQGVVLTDEEGCDVEDYCSRLRPRTKKISYRV